MIQMSNLDIANNKDSKNKYNNEGNEENHTLIMGGSSNHSLILNGKGSFDNIEALKTQKILVYHNNKEI